MKKGFLQIMFANIITLVIGILTNFLLPKYLSIESYAMVKTYALYLTYAGFFSLGYNDGMYLKYGGENLKNIDKKDFGRNFFNYFILIFLMTLFTLIVGIIFNDNIIIAFAFGIFSYNILGYLKSFYQATGEFKLYGRSLNIEKILIFILNMILLFIFKSDNSNYYIWIQVLSGIIICGFLTLKLNYNLHFFRYFKFSLEEIKENIKSGFILMLGNFSSGILTGLDRWVIKIFLTSVEFAMYSFAVSLENMINVFTTPITIAMYNYFCKKPKLKEIIMFKNSSLIWGTIVISLAYPAKFILENYLIKYKTANSIIFILFATQVFNIIVKGIYVNIYKSQKRQNKYLFQMICMIILATCLDLLAIYLFNNMILVAIATLLTTIIWMLMCEFEKNNEIKFTFREYIYIFSVITIYIFSGYCLPSVLGLLLYIISLIILSLIFMRETIIYLVKNLKTIVKSKLRI